MSWNWLTEFFTAPARVKELERKRDEKQLEFATIVLKFATCQSEKSKFFMDLTWAIKEKQNGLEIINTLNSEIQALKDSQNSTDIEKDKLIIELKATALRRQGTIENLTQQRDEARDILLAKYLQ